jgi:galactose mutarotase-like enzyme
MNNPKLPPKKSALLEYIGNHAQIGYARPYVLSDGRAKDLRCIDVSSGSGLRYTVVPDRGMDISLASYKGINLVYITPNGETHPAFYNPAGLEWLRTFAGGLLTTCGLTYLGPPVNDNGEELGLHGRYSAIPARQVADLSEWKNDEFHIKLRGITEEGRLFGNKLRLTREIETILGSSSLRITDTVTNFGYSPSPYTILYHMNFGYPLLDENAELDITASESVPRDAPAAAGVKQMKSFSKPQSGYAEQVFIHRMRAQEENYGMAVLRNRKLGIEVSLKFDITTLPYLIQWKMMGKGEYVLGLEPANVPVKDRKQLREEKLLPVLNQGESTVNSIEISVIDI